MDGAAVILVLTVLALALLIGSLHEVRRSIRPSTLMGQGAWAEARAAAEVLERSWMRVLPGVRDGAVYVRALCLHLEGHFDESLSLLGSLPSPPPKLVPAIRLLEGGDLVNLGRDLPRAVKLLEEACKVHTLPEDTMLLALALQGAGRREEAEEVFRRAGRTRPEKAGWPEVNEPVFHYLRATYLARTGRGAEAKEEFARASDSDTWTIYVARARTASTEQIAAEGREEPPSSLAALIIDSSRR